MSNLKTSKIIINGQKKLRGRIRTAGAKNAALPELAATILSAGESCLSGIPEVEDIKVMLHALENLGAEVTFKTGETCIRLPEIISPLVPREIVETSRASVLILGPLVARNGFARVSTPGGCQIGDRKINFHLEGLRRMGVEIHEEDEHIVATASKRLQAIDFEFPSPSVTGTENLLMAASLAEGTTVLRNCALEPEVADLVEMLIKMGAIITGKNTRTLTIEGKTSLNGANHRTIPDRIEMGTYVIAGCLGENEIVVENAMPGFIQSLLDVLANVGIHVIIEGDTIKIAANGRLKPIRVETLPYPGYPTDLQAQLTTLLTQAEGVSEIKENIFNNRFQHAVELNKMGARIELSGDIARISGKTPLTGATIHSTDLRASAALVLGGLIADGQTVVENAYQLFRGYEDMPVKLQRLGADIRIVE